MRDTPFADLWEKEKASPRGGPLSGEGTRTLDTADMSRMLYHLSYAAMTENDERDYSSRHLRCQPQRFLKPAP